MKLLRLISIILLFFTTSLNAKDKTTVKSLDLGKFLGTWYEIARYDHVFERGLSHCTATYSRRQDGMIEVLNKGIKNGKYSETLGKAKLTSEPGKLKVSFFLFFYADYYIFEMSPDYKYAIIGSSSDKYLWVLSKTPKISDALKSEIISKIQRRGYDTAPLIWVKHD